jgi:hypothetical protein
MQGLDGAKPVCHRVQLLDGNQQTQAREQRIRTGPDQLGPGWRHADTGPLL